MTMIMFTVHSQILTVVKVSDKSITIKININDIKLAVDRHYR